jgi:hypothetical protein
MFGKRRTSGLVKAIHWLSGAHAKSRISQASEGHERHGLRFDVDELQAVLLVGPGEVL